MLPLESVVADPGDVHAHPHPAPSAPQQRLDELDGLDPTRRAPCASRVLASPNRSRSPSGDSLTVKLKYFMNSRDDDEDRQAAGEQGEHQAAPAAAQERDDDDQRRSAGAGTPSNCAAAATGARSRGRHRRDRRLRRLADVVPQAGRTRQDLAAQRPRLVERQELQLELRVLRAPATSTVTSAIENNRATSGCATSTDCSRLSCSRRCCLVMTPESTRKSPSSSNQYHRLRQPRYCQPATTSGQDEQASTATATPLRPKAAPLPKPEDDHDERSRRAGPTPRARAA